MSIESQHSSRIEPVEVDPYELFREYDLERLAWEFLRRSAAFRTDCESVEAGTMSAKLVATRWGLYKFKHYRLEYKLEGRPRFLPTLVRYFPNLTNDPIEKRITLQPGHVALVLNAGALLRYAQAGEGQEKRLWRRVKKYVAGLASSGSAKPKQIQLKEHNYPECLQLLDLLLADTPVAEIKQQLPSVRRRQHDELTQKCGSRVEAAAAVNHRFAALKKQALLLANEGYLELAVVGAARRTDEK